MLLTRDDMNILLDALEHYNQGHPNDRITILSGRINDFLVGSPDPARNDCLFGVRLTTDIVSGERIVEKGTLRVIITGTPEEISDIRQKLETIITTRHAIDAIKGIREITNLDLHDASQVISWLCAELYRTTGKGYGAFRKGDLTR